MRYLDDDYISSALNRGKSVEQFLGKSPENPAYIRHVELRPKHDAIELWIYDLEDIGSEDFLDFYDFPILNEDDDEAPVATFEDTEAALSFAQEKVGAQKTRWTNALIGQSEYLDYIRADRPDRWPLER